MGYYVVDGRITGDLEDTMAYIVKNHMTATVVRAYLEECFQMDDLIESIANGAFDDVVATDFLYDALEEISRMDEGTGIAGIFYHEGEPSFNRKPFSKGIKNPLSKRKSRR